MYENIQMCQSQYVNDQPEQSVKDLWKDGSFFTDPSGMQYLTPKGKIINKSVTNVFLKFFTGHEVYERLEAMLRESSNLEDEELSGKSVSSVNYLFVNFCFCNFSDVVAEVEELDIDKSCEFYNEDAQVAGQFSDADE